MDVKIVRLNTRPLPSKATKGSAGYDLVTDFRDVNSLKFYGDHRIRPKTELNPVSYISIAPMTRVIIPAGIKISLPNGYEGQIRSRSGKSSKEGIVVVNAPGTIDSDYTGEVHIPIINLSTEWVDIYDNERIAQLLIKKVEQANWVEVQQLNNTERNENGFGSTGK